MMTTKERLRQLVEEMPEEKAGEWLRRIEIAEKTPETIPDDSSNGGFSSEFLATFDAWREKNDPRTTEEILKEFQAVRTGEERFYGMGMFAGTALSTEEYFRRKREDLEREEEQAERLHR